MATKEKQVELKAVEPVGSIEMKYKTVHSRESNLDKLNSKSGSSREERLLCPADYRYSEGYDRKSRIIAALNPGLEIQFFMQFITQCLVDRPR